ncbi:NADH-quinone oxidoreductase subunit NuoE [Candidatus Acetothermia bacterium]|jgi:NADH-quinone oxidoreductase subunit E|nr:NADH-quinone oxidoreductase subunit NuoE [Candidatus Acetothermia bacterium]MCI2427843.1 NADH-quinone oxidoreductase subunit NuoE [Candidatus Acetothermia bacterium]
MERVRDILTGYTGKRHELVPILQEIQTELGYLPEEALVMIATFTGIPESEAFAIATFYSQFRLTPTGRNRVMVCRGTACHVKGAPQILEEIENYLNIKEGETTPDLEFTLESVACIGCCALAPCIMVNNKDVHGRLTPKRVRGIFSDSKGKEQDTS